MRMPVGISLLLAGGLCLLFGSGQFVILDGRFVYLYLAVLPVIFGGGAIAAGLMVLMSRRRSAETRNK
jgi:hypothetical protein